MASFLKRLFWGKKPGPGLGAAMHQARQGQLEDSGPEAGEDPDVRTKDTAAAGIAVPVEDQAQVTGEGQELVGTKTNELPAPAYDGPQAEAAPTESGAVIPPGEACPADAPGPEIQSNRTEENGDRGKTEWAPPALARKIFILKGDDDKINRQVEQLLKNWDFDAVALPTKYDDCALDEWMKRHSSVKFAVIILSRDEFVYAKDSKPAAARLQSREDLVFKLGFLVGRLGKSSCFILYQEQKSYQLPTSLLHAIFTAHDDRGNWQAFLKDRLSLAGYKTGKG